MRKVVGRGESWNHEGAKGLGMIDVYVAAPYSDLVGSVRAGRFDAVTSYTALLMRHGVVAFSPITHCHPVSFYGLPGDWSFWARYDLAFLTLCRQMHVLQLEGWRESVGVTAEIGIMKGLGRLVIYVPPALVGVGDEG